ncbi:MAG: 50S ribosomal protein L7Ae [Candidatus Hodarchaeales archaeon]|jgi:large subunit ribosomal protein L7Ae
MSKPFYVNYEQPEGLDSDALAVLENVSNDPANISKGTNETTKSIERGEAKLVFIALDVDPPEIVAHLPLLCKDKKIPYLYIVSKEELGKACNLGVKTASCSIVNEGEIKARIDNLAVRIKELAGI